MLLLLLFGRLNTCTARLQQVQTAYQSLPPSASDSGLVEQQQAMFGNVGSVGAVSGRGLDDALEAKRRQQVWLLYRLKWLYLRYRFSYVV